jgi:hypothetical protein
MRFSKNNNNNANHLHRDIGDEINRNRERIARLEERIRLITENEGKHEHPDLVLTASQARELGKQLEERLTGGLDMHERFVTRQLPEINRKIEILQSDSKEMYITRAEFAAQFSPIRNAVTFIGALIITAVVGALLALIITSTAIAS